MFIPVIGIVLALALGIVLALRGLPRARIVAALLLIVALIASVGYLGFVLGGIDAGYRWRSTALGLIKTTDAAFTESGCDEVKAAFGAAKASCNSGGTIEESSRELVARLGAAGKPN